MNTLIIVGLALISTGLGLVWAGIPWQKPLPPFSVFCDGKGNWVVTEKNGKMQPIWVYNNAAEASDLATYLKNKAKNKEESTTDEVDRRYREGESIIRASAGQWKVCDEEQKP